jgi:16S rRNA (guanine527-N7)-methyltransferase
VTGPKPSPSYAAGIADLLERFGMTGEMGVQLERLAQVLGTNEAPSTVRDPVAIRDDHLADALIALQLPEVRAAGTIADLGAGAGVPGLPLAVARPAATVSLVESNRRKCEFMSRAIDLCAIANARVVGVRAEEWPEGLESFDLVTARALAALPVVAEYAAPLLRIGGALVAWRGRRDPEEEAAARVAAGELGLRVEDPVAVEPYPGVRNRHLQVMVKVQATPDRFPRRPGAARKRPLGTRARRAVDSEPSDVI